MIGLGLFLGAIVYAVASVIALEPIGILISVVIILILLLDGFQPRGRR